MTATIRVSRVWDDGDECRFWDRVVLVGEFGQTDPMRPDGYSPGRGMNAESFVRSLFWMRSDVVVIGPHHAMGRTQSADGRSLYQVLDLRGAPVVTMHRIEDLLLYGWDRLLDGPETPAETALSAEVLAEEEAARPVLGRGGWRGHR